MPTFEEVVGRKPAQPYEEFPMIDPRTRRLVPPPSEERPVRVTLTDIGDETPRIRLEEQDNEDIPF